MGNHISYNTTEHILDLGPKGKLRGLQFDDRARRYAGVPYALPPTGQHRWRRPRPLPLSHTYSGQGNEEPFDATAFHPPCHQESRVLFGAPSHGDGSGKTSEDCLVVNIWTPVAKPEGDKKWPVMIHIHGGWFQIGQPNQTVDADPTELISTGGLNAVVVAIGYRLNVFGFLATHHLVDEPSDGVDSVGGNFGLWDQRLALEWIYENIAAFGGDAGNMTLSGISAGAYSVEAQALHDFRGEQTDVTGKLFHRLFMRSNAIPAQPKTVADAEAQFDELCEHFDIPVGLPGREKLQKLRSVDGEELVAALSHLKNHTFRPVTDDVFIHSDMVEYFRGGSFASEFKKRGMRVLIGEVQNEETLYAEFGSPQEPTSEALRLQISNYYSPSTTDRILKKYALPASTDLSGWKSLFGDIIADGQVRASTRCFVQDLYGNGVPLSDIWRYKIDYRCDCIDEKQAPASFGTAHSMDGPLWNFGIALGPSDEWEQRYMQQWVNILAAFVQNDGSFEFGTTRIDQVKAALGDRAGISLPLDERYKQLLELGDVFAGRSA